ncbi:hypothetical protein [Thermogemmata fonticola]|jgi:hypothetical protein|uniref:Uncharacterized protein n=1 Tax=Thermogemmata fonticola TaxID=2755323 RepID=A0A7V8VGK3_9BACT|nr:hypothetical protein [Thermogemmata fonticola]MBA2227515.1 hypothetical protein [Thermogemmata fonticola]
MFDWLFAKKTKTVHTRKGWFGDRITDVTYHDTGRKVRYRTRPGIFGGKVTKAYELRKGKKKN